MLAQGRDSRPGVADWGQVKAHLLHRHIPQHAERLRQKVRATGPADLHAVVQFSDQPPMPKSGLTVARQPAAKSLRHRNCSAVDQTSRPPVDQGYLEEGDTLLWYVLSSEGLVFGLKRETARNRIWREVSVVHMVEVRVEEMSRSD